MNKKGSKKRYVALGIIAILIIFGAWIGIRNYNLIMAENKLANSISTASSLGISTANTPTSQCVAEAGYSCSGLNFSFGGVVADTLGQSTGSNWENASFVFLLPGIESSFLSNESLFFSEYLQQSGLETSVAMPSGTTRSVYMPVAGNITNATVGTLISGQIWVQYKIVGGEKFYYSEIGVAAVPYN